MPIKPHLLILVYLHEPLLIRNLKNRAYQ